MKSVSTYCVKSWCSAAEVELTEKPQLQFDAVVNGISEDSMAREIRKESILVQFCVLDRTDAD